MKSIGKPDAGNPHVRFDERGRETEPLAQRLNATAPFLDSTATLAMTFKWNRLFLGVAYAARTAVSSH
jgi:hypothetical protein